MENFQTGVVELRDYRNIKHVDRDNLLGTVSSYPETYLTDIQGLERHSQKNIPACGSHASVHLKQALDKSDTGINSYSPMFVWREIKLIDKLPPSWGTTMEAIFKELKSKGACDNDLLPTDFSLDETTQAYTAINPKHEENAQPRIIKSYAISLNPTQDDVRRIISTDKVAILILRFDNSWWHSDVLETNGKPTYGHFVCAYGYDADYIYVIDSADDNYPYKKIGRNFPIYSIGSAVDLPDEYVKSLVSRRTLLQNIVELYRQLKSLLKA